MDRSELLGEALRRHLLQPAGERDAETWGRAPLTADEQLLTAIKEWGPAEDWARLGRCSAVRSGSPRRPAGTGC